MNLSPPFNWRQLLSVIVSVIFVFVLVACQPAEEEPDSYTVGIVSLTSSFDSTIDGFKQGMEQFGYVEGENITYIYDGPANSIEKLDGVVEDLIAQDVDMLFVISTPAALAAQKVTAGTDMPTLFAPINDAVAAGLVESMSQPGGNLTGIQVGGFLPKEFAWLLDLDPTIETVFAPYNPDDQSSALGWEIVQAEAAASDVTLIAPEVRSPEDIQAAIADMPDSVDGIFLLTDAVVLSQIVAFSEAAIERGLPLASINEEQAEAGALIGYGPEFFPVGEQAARLGDQILQGASPAHLPVETADFFLSINMRTAKELGLEISNGILQQANNIIR